MQVFERDDLRAILLAGFVEHAEVAAYQVNFGGGGDGVSGRFSGACVRIHGRGFGAAAEQVFEYRLGSTVLLRPPKPFRDIAAILSYA